MLKVGIVGYGNLGQALEKLLTNNEVFKLVKIFSNRKLENTESVKNILKYKDDIDIIFLCCGSQSELEPAAHKLIENFNTIDVYDNHSRLKKYIEKMDKLAKANNKVALCALGWDPGLLSLMRGMFDSLNCPPLTVWGKGLSQGHTNAIKNIDGVIDALQFTIPNKKAIKQFYSGKLLTNKDLHTRLCYVVANKKNYKTIKNEIVTMPDYFDGYKTKIKFVGLEKLNKLRNFSHAGKVITKDKSLCLCINAKSNPEFTAQIMLTYAKCFESLFNKEKYGAYTIFDLPISNILLKEKYIYL